MKSDFYKEKSYILEQSLKTKSSWQKGEHNSLFKRIERKCERRFCSNKFVVIPSDPKKFCSSKCAAIKNNIGKIKSEETRLKISKALSGKKYPERQGIKLVDFVCQNPECKKIFKSSSWKKPKYCSNACAILVIGRKPTSAKAARAKSGIRLDIDEKTYFYSRWEANYARILNLKKIKWIHQPKRFKLVNHFYTPDFYLPDINTYVEIKNFLSDYSLNRDREFRRLYPKEKLKMILKKDYLKLQKKYSGIIKEWEFS